MKLLLAASLVIFVSACKSAVPKSAEELAGKKNSPIEQPIPAPNPTPAPTPEPVPTPTPTPVPFPTPTPDIAPNLEITSGPQDLSNATTADFTFTVAATNLQQVECQRDGNPVENCTSPKHYDGVGGARHTFRVKAYDANGLTAEKTYQWTVDLSGPTITLSKTPLAEDASTSATFEFSSTDQSGIAEFQCQLDSSAYATCASPKTYSLSGGTHTFKVRAQDGSGNLGDEKTFTWKILSVPSYDQSFITFSKSYQPNQINGWFPKISPTGLYVGCGFGQTFILEPSTDRIWPFNARSYWPHWIQPDVLTYVREDNDNGTLQTRFEVPVSSMIAIPQAGDPAILAGSKFVADGGHWASQQAGSSRKLAYDGAVLANDSGPAIWISQNWLSFARNVGGMNGAVAVYRDGVHVRDYPLGAGVGEAHEIAIGRGYVVYGGYGNIRGIDPNGNDIDLTIAPWKWEARAMVFFVGGNPWVASTSYSSKWERGYILLRPWGAQEAIVLEDGDAASLDVVEVNGEIIVVMNTPNGVLSVRKMRSDSPRVRIVE
jgi:hypothetical protein